MLFVLLCDLTGVSIKLQDLLVCTTGKEYVLFIICRMEFDTEGSFVVRERADHLPGLSVPQLDNLIESCTKEATAIIAETNVPYSLLVAHVGS